jgi:hypothetical protein
LTRSRLSIAWQHGLSRAPLHRNRPAGFQGERRGHGPSGSLSRTQPSLPPSTPGSDNERANVIAIGRLDRPRTPPCCRPAIRSRTWSVHAIPSRSESTWTPTRFATARSVGRLAFFFGGAGPAPRGAGSETRGAKRLPRWCTRRARSGDAKRWPMWSAGCGAPVLRSLPPGPPGGTGVRGGLLYAGTRSE